MRRWPWILGWVGAAAAASAVGFVAIALVGGGLEPISSPSDASAAGPIGALAPSPAPASATPTSAPRPTTSARPSNAAAVPDDSTDAVGDSSKVSAPRPTKSGSSSSRPGTSSGTSARPSTSSGVVRSASTAGGSATARCVGERISLTAWSPAPGFTVGSVKAGPGSSVEVRFTSSTRRVELKAECSNGTPKFESEVGGADDD